MRIAIVSYGRTGSTTLSKYVCSSFNYNFISEPFNEDLKHNYTEAELWENDNIVVKFPLPSIDKLDLIKLKFDKIIYLTRENDKEAAESWVQAVRTGNWGETYIYTEVAPNIIRGYINSMKEKRKKIRSLGGFQVTYEKIYYEGSDIKKINQYLGISTDRFEGLLKLDNKYRKKTNNKNTI